MYRSTLSRRDKARATLAVAAVHALLLLALLHMAGTLADGGPPQAMLQVFDVREVPPPPPPTPPPPPPKRARSHGGAAPANIRSEATPVTAPKPAIALPPLQQIATTLTPAAGALSTQGAAVPGSGTSSGGSGSGTGSGGGAAGAGDDDGAATEPPHLVTPVLRGRDIPRETLEAWPGRATVFMRLRVDAQGLVAECTIDRGTGLSAVDDTLCNLAHERLRFRPAANRNGQAVAGWFGYAQPAPR